VAVAVHASKSHVLLLPNQQTNLEANGTLRSIALADASVSKAWVTHKMLFTSVSIPDVFAEIARQYAVNISLDQGLTGTYTGNFDKTQDIDSVLDLVCKPMGLRFAKQTQDQYHIYANQ
jgi:ferric-dicitrate binding protein FerR (iron transport regulator)